MIHIHEEAARCLLCEDAPCTKACKTGDTARAIRAIRFDNAKNAWRWIEGCSPADLERAEQACMMMVRIDGKSGTLKGSLSVEPTHGEWQEVTCELKSPITGQCDLFFTFKAKEDCKLDFDSWQFSDGSTGIGEVRRQEPTGKGDVYDLLGRKAKGHGLRIVDGKKVVK